MIYEMISLFDKIKRKVWGKLVFFLRRKRCYPLIYRSWWHCKFFKSGGYSSQENFIAAVPNPGAGIGHQMANWIAGLWFADQFKIAHAHIPFSSPKWEELLGFGQQAVSAETLLKKQGYKKVVLPLFDEEDEKQVAKIRQIIASYIGRQVVFIMEQDQFYRDQFGVIDEIQRRFYSATARTNDATRYNSKDLNIAIHVRRGDITIGQKTGNENLAMRWQNAEYFKNVLSNTINLLKTNRTIKVYLFSQGVRSDFREFESIENIEFCLDMDAQVSFLHMVHADLLITSKSSFSYKPALLSRGIKVCPRDFWHGYPDSKDWILVDENGEMHEDQDFIYI